MIQLSNFYLDLMLWIFTKRVIKEWMGISSGKHHIIIFLSPSTCYEPLLILMMYSS
jgi:hypothetical protein